MDDGNVSLLDSLAGKAKWLIKNRRDLVPIIKEKISHMSGTWKCRAVPVSCETAKEGPCNHIHKPGDYLIDHNKFFELDIEKSTRIQASLIGALFSIPIALLGAVIFFLISSIVGEVFFSWTGIVGAVFEVVQSLVEI